MTLDEIQEPTLVAKGPQRTRWLGGASAALAAGVVVMVLFAVFADSEIGAPGVCQFTIPTGNGPSVNDGVLPPPQSTGWHGGPELTTFLPVEGAVWADLPVTGERRTQKIFVWADGYDWIEEPNPSLEIDVRQADGGTDLPLPSTAVSNGSRADWGSFMVVGLDLAPGCWEVELDYRGSVLEFIVEVLD